MNNNVILIKDFTPKAGDAFLFDNNIWMFLFGPIANYEKDKQKQYSRLFDNLIARKLPIYTNSLILSEFSNALLRMHWKKLKEEKITAGSYDNYKLHYIGSSPFKKYFQIVKTSIDDILEVCSKAPDDFNSLDLPEVLQLHERIDFNDSYYIILAKKKNWTIVTDDKDIVKNAGLHNVRVVTYK